MGMTKARARMHAARLQQGSAAGFTLVELTVGIVIMGLLASLGVSGWFSYQRSVEHRGSAQELVSALRNAQQASLAEAVTYCVDFDTAARSYRVHKYSCASTVTAVKPAAKTKSPRVTLVSPAFLQPDGTTADAVSFYPRGSATKGQVRVARQDSGKTYTISVEGLTGRVSLAG